MRALCDCHMHILDHRYPLWSGAVLDPPDASVADYEKVRERLGIAHCVIAAPSLYGADNRCTRDALESIGKSARATAVITADSSPREIAQLAEAGFVAARFNCVQGGPWRIDELPDIARRVADVGWHIQVYATPDQVAGMAECLRSLPTPLVFEHCATIRDPLGVDAPAWSAILSLAERDRAWVMLSAPYLAPQQPGGFERAVAAFAQAMPERLLWGSDWPHATEGPTDTAELLTRFREVVNDAGLLEKILVTNPMRLYGFQ